MHLREPVLWRKPGELQVGAGPERTVILRGLSAAETDILLDLQCPRTPAWLQGALARHGIPADRWQEIWDAAQAAPPTPPGFSPPLLVALLDAHEITLQAGMELARAGATVERARPGDLERTPSLAILTDHHVSDPLRTALLLRQDVPHLPIVVDGEGVSVGPVVLPGITGCCQCLERARADEDECWPAVATQLRYVAAPRPEPVLVRLAAQVATWLARNPLDGVPGGGVRITRRELLPIPPTSFHPECACSGVTPPFGGGPDPV